MKKKAVAYVLALVLSVAGIVGFAETVNAAGCYCYEEIRPFDLGSYNGD